MSNASLSVAEVALLDEITGTPLIGSASGALILGLAAVTVGINRLRSTNRVRERSLRIQVARLNKRASNLAELDFKSQRNSWRYRREAWSVRRSLRTIRALDANLVSLGGRTKTLTPTSGVTVTVSV